MLDQEGINIPEETVPTYSEWVKERQNITNELRARASAYYDSAPTQQRKDYWSWIRETFQELNRAFHALEWVENYQKEADFKII